MNKNVSRSINRARSGVKVALQPGSLLHRAKLLGLSSILTLTLAGCGGGDDELGTEPNPNPSSFTGTGQEALLEFGCVACHGADGLQKSQPIVFENYTLETLIKKIDETMPYSEADPNAWMQCVGDCARAVGEYLWSIKPETSCTGEEAVLPRKLRLLSKFEYINTINDLFGRTDGTALASGIGADTIESGFDNNTSVNGITSTRMGGYWRAAEGIAAEIDAQQLLNNLNCTQQDAAGCFVDAFGLRTFRRPLTAEERTDYMALFASGSSNEEGARYVVQTMLVSPNFLYRTELGQNGRLTSYEVATLLAYTFWGTTPDAALLSKAANNSLGTVAQLKETVNAMIADPKARKQFVHFGRQWLEVENVANVERDSTLFPRYNANVARAMDQEVELFLQEIMLGEGYGIADFFDSGFTYVNQDLANYYGINGVSGNQMQRVATDDQRGGVLKLGAVHVRNASQKEGHPIFRGLLVRRNLLCQQFGAPPPNIDLGEIESLDPSLPTRERFAIHSQSEACASCHQYIDDIGFAFEHYDAAGGYRELERNGDPVDASGRITGLVRMADPDGYDFMDLTDLSSILSNEGASSTASCIAEQFNRMMIGASEVDQCTVDNIVSRWNPATSSIKDLWLEIVASQTFAQRQ